MKASSFAAFSTVFFALLAAAHAQRYRGHWQKTWRVPSTAFTSANLGFAFSGYSDVGTAASESRRVFRNLEGSKILTIGGGNYNGRWSRTAIRNVNNAIRRGQFRSYRGIAYDIEEGDSGLTNEFLSSFRRAKRAGLFVVVTVSHTAPYGFTDAGRIVNGLVRSRYIDVLSPMMYSSGLAFQQCSSRGGLSTQTTRGVPWSRYARSRAAVVPSIWRPSYYRRARSFLRRHGVSIQGYITWC